jgi:hypothetical protein
MRGLPSIEVAEALARELLEPLGNRWAHTQAVAARANQIAPAVESAEGRPLLLVAAWWHDLGYAPTLRDTGCHQIDGARYLTRENYPERLVALVAHHSAATCEAAERGLLGELDVWPQEESPVADALWTADMTTGPGGEGVELRRAPVRNLGPLPADVDRWSSDAAGGAGHPCRDRTGWAANAGRLDDLRRCPTEERASSMVSRRFGKDDATRDHHLRQLDRRRWNPFGFA